MQECLVPRRLSVIQRRRRHRLHDITFTAIVLHSLFAILDMQMKSVVAKYGFCLTNSGFVWSESLPYPLIVRSTLHSDGQLVPRLTNSPLFACSGIEIYIKFSLSTIYFHPRGPMTLSNFVMHLGTRKAGPSFYPLRSTWLPACNMQVLTPAYEMGKPPRRSQGAIILACLASRSSMNVSSSCINVCVNVNTIVR